MNVSYWIYPAVACISLSIGTSQADPKATLRGRARSELAAVLGAVTADALTLEGPIGLFL
jgi:hypothetical protein